VLSTTEQMKINQLAHPDHMDRMDISRLAYQADS
jgi:hypothetical protein